MRTAAIAVALVTAVALAYLGLVRPWYRTWGATPEEERRGLPGDARWPDAAWVETRAVTIAAPPERVWPWIAQIGQDRAGFYSYRWVENLLGCEIPEVHRLLGVPDPKPGDRLWLYPRAKAGGEGYATYVEVVPGRAMVLLVRELPVPGLGGPARPSGTWTFVLEPVGAFATRLLVRNRSGREGAVSAGRWLAEAFLLDPARFAMERKMLVTVKARAEGRAPAPAWVDVTEIVLWVVTAALAAATSIALLLRRRAWWRSLATATLALFVLTLLFFARPPLAVAILLVGLLRWALARAWAKPRAATGA